MSIGGYNHKLHYPGAETHVIQYADTGYYDVQIDSVSVISGFFHFFLFLTIGLWNYFIEFWFY